MLCANGDSTVSTNFNILFVATLINATERSVCPRSTGKHIGNNLVNDGHLQNSTVEDQPLKACLFRQNNYVQNTNITLMVQTCHSDNSLLSSAVSNYR